MIQVFKTFYIMDNTNISILYAPVRFDELGYINARINIQTATGDHASALYIAHLHMVGRPYIVFNILLMNII